MPRGETAVIERAINSSPVADSQLRRAWLDGRHGPGQRQSESRPAPQDGDRRPHSFNVSYLGHGVKEAGRPLKTTGLLGDEGDFAVFLASGLYGDLHVLAEGGEKVHDALDGNGDGPIAHQGRDMRLLNAENLAGNGLLEAAFFDEAVNLKREPRFQELLLGMGQ